jgi:hypothetical protein
VLRARAASTVLASFTRREGLRKTTNSMEQSPLSEAGSRSDGHEILSILWIPKSQCLTTDWTTGVRSPTGAEDFSPSLCVQTGCWAHPASCPMGTGVLSPGLKRGRGVMLTTHPHLVPRLSMSRSYTSSPPMRLHGL